MTSKQLKLLETIEEYWEEFGCGPSLDALADALGLSSKSNILDSFAVSLYLVIHNLLLYYLLTPVELKGTANYV